MGDRADAAGPEAGASIPLLRRGGALEQRLVVLMAARLVLALVSLGIAFAVDATLGDVDGPGRRGLYGTVAFAFLATALYGVVLPRIRRPQRFAALNIAADIAIVSALVHFSGGADSLLAFLYLLVAVYGALLFDRRGALITAGLGVLSYGAVLLAAHAGWAGAPPVRATPGTLLFTVWALHAGAIVLVAALASFLAAELRRTGEALRQRTRALRSLERLHERTVESLMSGLLTTDAEGRVTSFNPEAERITGVSAAEALGAELEAVLPGVGAAALGRVGAAGTRTRARTPFRNRRGEDLHLGTAAYVLRDAEGGASGHVLIFQDVTEVVAMEEELRRSERLAAVGRLSAGIAHEIRNPLAAISGSLEMLRRESRGGAALARPEAGRLMDIALRETDRLNGLIGDFLRYARPGPLTLAPLALAAAATEVVEALAPTLPAGIEARLEVAPGLAVLADAGQLRQVLWNLLLNAVQAMPAGGRVVLSARPASDAAPSPQEAVGAGRNGAEEKPAWVEIAVADQGVGIDPEVLERVFDPFFTTRAEGTGLGLPTVHRIVQEHGASIRLESEVGRGTVVRIRWPRAEVTA